MFVAIASTTAFGATTSATESADLVIKQTINFEHGQPPITIYYVKENSLYKVYSETDLSKQSPSQLKKMSKSKIELAKSYKGKCYMTCDNLKEVLDLGADLYSKYKHYVDFDKVEF